jgi:MFS transporter, DHA2 family, multidrug resistance protein
MTEAAGTRRWWALGAIVLGVLAVVLDVTVLSVALPTLATDLHASTSDLQWFTAGYALSWPRPCCRPGCWETASDAGR